MYIFKLLGQYFLCTVFASCVASIKLKLIMNVFAICRAKHIHQHKDAIVLPNSLFLKVYCNDLAF